ncbi:hypothetical protein HPB51_008459 [Rhipicephalus microplus]|uniref:non-specific serine/threonine protein kinase n=1 Tax=Rhipicephalus microplus TaxID=6941 RepID=A0A9J6ER94_RHIMP|nr:hypothetical protein HPB51_008459 [Rhipicephalus microplus]
MLYTTSRGNAFSAHMYRRLADKQAKNSFIRRRRSFPPLGGNIGGPHPRLEGKRSVKEPADSPTAGTAAMPTPVTGGATSTGAAAALSNNVAAASKDGAEEPKQPAKMCANDFIFGKLIGEGSFSMVYLAKEVRTNKEYAIKVCYKQHIIREKKQRAIMREKQILRILSARPHPFFIRLHSTFHDANKLYFVVTYAKNGELLPHIVKYGSFDVDVTRFYTAEIVSALEHLHSLGIVHRDLKPENILLDERMHVQITDFGSAKIISREFCDEVDIGEIELNGHNSFVGTAQYVSPEMLSDKSCSPRNEYLTFQKILKLKYEFPDGFNPVVRDLVENLLVLDPNQRLGAATRGGYPVLKQHEFFAEVRWEKLPETDPPKMLPFLPGTSSNEELRSHYCVSSLTRDASTMRLCSVSYVGSGGLWCFDDSSLRPGSLDQGRLGLKVGAAKQGRLSVLSPRACRRSLKGSQLFFFNRMGGTADGARIRYRCSAVESDVAANQQSGSRNSGGPGIRPRLTRTTPVGLAHEPAPGHCTRQEPFGRSRPWT